MQDNQEYFKLIHHVLPLVEKVHCAHWENQRILVAMGPHNVAKLSPIGDDRLEWERIFVRHVLNYLLERNITPCLTAYRDAVKCEPQSPHGIMLWRQLERNEQKERRRDEQKSPLSVPTPFFSKETPKTKETLVGFVIERARGVTLHQWAQQKHSLRQWTYVLFQLLYTVDAMRALGIRHNDLHWDNIFIDDAGWSKPLQFILPTTTKGRINLPLGKEAPAVRLIDFDKASVSVNHVRTNKQGLPREWQTLLQNNPILENGLCTSYGLCNRDLNQKYDAHTVLCFIMYGISHYRYQVPEKVQTWIKNEAMPHGKHLYDTDFGANGGYTCRLGKPFCTSGTSYQPSDLEQRPTLSLLTNSSLFLPLFSLPQHSFNETLEKTIYKHPEA